MSEITLLDKNTIDKIAAGEVVERPSSVVKELCENSIDAKATAISIEIKDGGTKLIRITDNGTGIEESQIETAFLRHSTSKIKSAEDLSFIKTLGFRGEALSSISAVSKLELCTKTKDSLTGTIYKAEGGTKVEEMQAGLPDGTTIIIRDLFYNTPARLKFLKSAQTEASYIADIIEKTALAHPEISFKFVSNNVVKLLTSGNGSLKDVIYAIYGKYVASNILDVKGHYGLFSIAGFAGKPEFSRGNRNYEIYFINNRYVKDKIIAQAIEEAYKGYMMKGCFPFTVLNISIEPELIDVNVHPSKMEIRFFDNERAYEAIKNILLPVISKRESIPNADIEYKKAFKAEPYCGTAYEPFETSRDSKENTGTANYINKDEEAANSNNENKYYQEQNSDLTGKCEIPDSSNGSFVAESKAVYEKTETEKSNFQPDEPQEYKVISEEVKSPAEVIKTGKQTELFEDNFLSEKARSRHKIVGEVFDTYWIVEYDDKMFVIDQHAAHEKVIYEEMLEKIKNSMHYSQKIMPAIILTLNQSEEEVVNRFKNQFESLGFEIEHFGGKEYAVNAVPANLSSLNNKQLFISLLDELTDVGTHASYEIITDRIAQAACKAAVKGGNKLSFAEADSLISKLMTLENPYNCPHGRPTIISMSKTELEKKFKRIV